MYLSLILSMTKEQFVMIISLFWRWTFLFCWSTSWYWLFLFWPFLRLWSGIILQFSAKFLHICVCSQNCSIWFALSVSLFMLRIKISLLNMWHWIHTFWLVVVSWQCYKEFQCIGHCFWWIVIITFILKVRKENLKLMNFKKVHFNIEL